MARVRDGLKAHVETLRPDRLGYIGLVSVSGAVLASTAVSWWTLAGAWLAPTLGWVAALYGGDYLDRRLDEVAKPERPIPSGRMRPAAALAAMAVCAVAGAVVAVVLDPAELAVVAAAALLAYAYSAFLKERGLLGNFVRGGPTAGAFAFGCVAATGAVPLELIPIAVAFWLHDTASNLIGALRDADGDREGGYRTVPVRFGPMVARRAAVALYALALTLAAVSPLTPHVRLHVTSFLLFLAASAVLGAGALRTLVRAPRAAASAAAARAHRIIVLERLVFASAFVAAAGRVFLALAALAVAVPAALGCQLLLRRREPVSTAPAPDADAIRAYVDRTLRLLGATPAFTAGLASWRRKIEVELTDLDAAIFLLLDGSSPARVERRAFDESGVPAIRISTTGATFREIFLTRATNPRRAYLTGKVAIDGSSRDMLRLNQLFNEMRALEGRAPLQTRERAVSAPEEERLPERVVIADTTLRDGEQMPGVAFGIEEKIQLARMLDELGVPLIEAGYPVVSPSEAAAVREIASLGLDAVVQVIARPVAGDIEAALESGAESIALFVGTSDSHLSEKLRTSRDDVIAQIGAAVAEVKREGRQAVFAAEDATRTPLEFLLEALEAAAASGADAVAIADTVGIATPRQMADLVRAAAAAVDVPIAVHCHDDLGLATANSIAGLLAGASAVQCSVLGIGERAGNAALEEVALALEVAYGVRTGLRLAELNSVAAYVAGIVGQPVSPNKAVVGANAFVHESGLHLDGVVREPRTYEPFAPEVVGASRRFVFGKHSGRRAIAHVLEHHRIAADDALVESLVADVKRSGEAKDAIDETELVARAGALRRRNRTVHLAKGEAQ